MKVHLLAVSVLCTWDRTFMKWLASHGVAGDTGVACNFLRDAASFGTGDSFVRAKDPV